MNTLYIISTKELAMYQERYWKHSQSFYLMDDTILTTLAPGIKSAQAFIPFILQY